MARLIDLFSGCGGLSLGFQQAGFEIVAAYDNWQPAIDIYRANFDHPIYKRDLAREDIVEELTALHPDIIIGGPPCQGFSMANRQRIIDDPRNNLYRQFLIFLKHIRPCFFIMENVKGMMNKINEIKENFNAALGADYQYDFAILKAQDFGVPQNRERFIMIGNRMGIPPRDIFEEIYKFKRKPFTLHDALVGLPHLASKKEKGAKGIECAESGFTVCDYEYIYNDFYHFINGDKKLHKLYNHKNRYNNKRDLEIYRRLPQGANSLHESIADIMPYKNRNGIFKDKYFKLDKTQICKTITSHMKFDCNMYIHPWEARGLSPREAARIQTFPDDYVFTGSQNMWYAQIGNAVPVKLAKAIGLAIMKFIQ